MYVTYLSLLISHLFKSSHLHWFSTYTGSPHGLTECYSGDQIENNDMSGACGTKGRQEKFIQDFGGET
jgi:hypothetical protein